MIDDSDYAEMQNCYARALDGKRFKKAHKINLDHVEEAVKGIINKNSGELLIKNIES